MAFSVTKTAAAYAFILLCVFDLSVARVLSGDRWLPVPERVSMSMAILRGPVPPSARNPCSFIPRLGRGRCALSDVEDGAGAGGTSAFPGMNVGGFGAPSMVNQTQKEDPSLSS